MGSLTSLFRPATMAKRKAKEIGGAETTHPLWLVDIMGASFWFPGLPKKELCGFLEHGIQNYMTWGYHGKSQDRDI